MFFKIADTYTDTLVTKYKQKLSNNGWTVVYDNGYQYEYKKGDIHVSFINVQESFEYYYWNYYAFIVD